MNLPNCLTIFRILISFICIGLMILGSYPHLVFAFILFLIASMTDFFDGYIARKYDLVSNLGKLLDPIADKVLVLGVFSAFLVLKIVSPWMVILIVIRELVVTGVRLLVLKKGKVLSAQKWGKLKAATQMVGIGLIFLILIINPSILDNQLGLNLGICLIMFYIVLITVFSGVHYLWVNRKIISST